MEEAATDREQGKDDDVDAAAGSLTYEIFSLLESKFLFGCDAVRPSGRRLLPPATASASTGKVCVLSIDGGARAADGLLAGAALVRLEAALRRCSGSPAARLADFFDVAAGSGAGGVLAALLFARGPPMFSADDALAFLLRRARRHRFAGGLGLLRLAHRGRPFPSSSSSAAAAAAFGRALGDLTLRDTVRPVLVPCYDLATRAPFLFSRADAAERAAHDFRLRDVCAATCAGGAGRGRVVEVASVDGATRVRAVGGALGNPTAAAVTHVLNNRREFPGAASIDDLLVLSIGTGAGAGEPEAASIAAEGVSDMVRNVRTYGGTSTNRARERHRASINFRHVDQAVAMAFGRSRTTNYIRIQAVWKAEAMLLQRGVESVLFQGRKLSGETNAEKVERFAREMAREHARRKKKQQQQQEMGPCLPVVAAAASGAAAPPNNDKPPPTTTTTANAAKKKHTPATSRPDGGGTR
ncbi:Patatin-like protein 3 [Zea mays]|uniref:Patatin n=1 Tax=Zea mays TaxID=4577 RepID=A0A3L6E0V1_MAIZE|nr:Patatin-like protein 3 [Zea mays]